MGKGILTFGNIEIGKNKFYRNKTPIFWETQILKKYQCLTNLVVYNIGYLYNDNKVKSLNIMLPETSAYVKSYDGQTKQMYFLIEGDDLLEKYNTILDKVSANIRKRI